MTDTPEERFWITGMLPNDQVWMAVYLWVILCGLTVMLAGQAFALFDTLSNIKAKSGIIQAPDYEKREWAEETKYYTTQGATEDVHNKNDQDDQLETKAQLTSRAGLVQPDQYEMPKDAADDNNTNELS